MSETLDEDRHVSSTSVTTTTLEQVNDREYLLRISGTVEVDGKRLVAQPQMVRYGLLGESPGEPTNIRHRPTERIQIENKNVSCKVVEVESASEKGKRTTTLYYADNVPPYLLRRHSRTFALADGKILKETVIEVNHLMMPRNVLTDVMWTAEVKTVRTDGKGSTITLAFQSDEIPGGIVEQMSKELDLSGTVIRRSTLQLVDYGTKGADLQPN